MDLRLAIEAGLPFCRAANGVVLSEGPIPLRLLRRVMVGVGCADVATMGRAVGRKGGGCGATAGKTTVCASLMNCRH